MDFSRIATYKLIYIYIYTKMFSYNGNIYKNLGKLDSTVVLHVLNIL